MGNVAKLTTFKVDNSSAVLTDISAKIISVKFPRDVDAVDSSTMQQGGTRSYNAGLSKATIQIEFNYDSTIDAHLSGVFGQDSPLLNFEYGPINNVASSGNPKYTGLCILTKLEPPVQVGQLIKGTAEFTVSGAITRSTY